MEPIVEGSRATFKVLGPYLQTGTPVETLDAVGVPAGAAEAMAFSLMGRNALLGIPNHLPATTGATRSAVLGEIVPGREGLTQYPTR